MKRLIVTILMMLLSFSMFAEVSKNITNLTDANFKAEVIDSKIPVLVDFWAPWCGPCKKLGPLIEELADENHTRMKFTKLNVDNNRNSAGKYGIRSIPTVAVFVDGKPIDGFVGLQSKAEINKLIEKYFVEESQIPSKKIQKIEKSEKL